MPRCGSQSLAAARTGAAGGGRWRRRAGCDMVASVTADRESALSQPLRNPRRALLAAAFFASLPFQVAAQEGGLPQSDEALGAAAREWLEQRLLRDERVAALEIEGAVTVESDGQERRIALPGGRLLLAGERGGLLFDEAELLLTPRPDGLFGLSWRLPSAITLDPGSERPEAAAAMTLQRQSGQGLYAPETGSFLAFDALLGGLALALPEEAALTLGELGLSGDSHPRDETGNEAAALFDSNGSGHLRDLLFTGGGARLGFDALRLDAALDGLELAAYAEAVAALGDESAAAPPLFSFTSPLFEAGAVSLDVASLAFEAGAQSLALERGEVALAIDGLRGARSAIVLRADLEDLRMTPLPPLTGGLLPRNLLLDLEILGLPNAEIDALQRQLSLVAATAGTRYAAGMGLPDLWRLLQRAEAELRLAGLRWDSTLLRLEGDAMLNPNAQAALGFFGQLRFEIEGLPQLLEQLRGEPQAQRLLQLLTLVQGLGIPLDPARPAGARRYDVVVTSDGRLEVNGTDVMPLLPGPRR